jgi:glutaredoxin-like protein
MMTNRLLNDEVLEQVREVFKQLQHPVQVLFFGSKNDCEYCEDTRQLVEEVVDLSDLLGMTVYDIDLDAEIVRQYQVDKVPGLVMVAKEGDQLVDYGIRFAGVPSGHEFSSLVHDLLLVSGRDSGLSDKTRAFLAGLKKPILLQVFVTPTCPYCPRAVVLAHQMAIESPFVQAEMVEAMEFPELSNRFQVSGVPQTTINQGVNSVVGAVPEEYLVGEIESALQESS